MCVDQNMSRVIKETLICSGFVITGQMFKNSKGNYFHNIPVKDVIFFSILKRKLK